MDSSWFGRHKGLTVVLILICVGVLFIVSYAIRVAMLPARVAGGALRTAEGVIDRTFDADKALINYHQFRQWCQVYQKGIADAKLIQSSLAQLLEDYPTPMTRTEDIRDSITDYRFKRDASLTNANRVAADYNAAASNITMSIFKGEWLDNLLKGETRVDLPDTLELIIESNL